MGRKHTHYSTEFRAEAVRLAETSGQSIRKVAMDLGISNEASPAEAKAAVFEYIEVFYNRIRRHSSLGNLSPDQFEERYRSSPAAKAV